MMVQQTVVMDSAYSKKEEFWNALTHGAGCVLTIPGILLLMDKAFQEQSMLHLISYLIFGISMMLMFLASTLYHTVPAQKSFFKKLDHGAIFLLIAGTYTPVALVAIGGKVGWTIVAIEWGLALLGIIMKQFYVHRFKALSLMTYIGMGWVAIFVYEPLLAYMTKAGLVTLILGGVFYTAGTYFYKNNKIPYNHAIWHLFVLAGCLMMYLTVYLYI